MWGRGERKNGRKAESRREPLKKLRNSELWCGGGGSSPVEGNGWKPVVHVLDISMTARGQIFDTPVLNLHLLVVFCVHILQLQSDAVWSIYQFLNSEFFWMCKCDLRYLEPWLLLFSLWFQCIYVSGTNMLKVQDYSTLKFKTLA